MTPEPGSRGGAAGNGERNARLDRLYGETAGQEPPAHLDAAIRAAARREVDAGPRPMASRFRQWRVPVSIAAVVVLSASLVILVREEGGAPLEMAPSASSTPKSSAADAARQPPAQPAPLPEAASTPSATRNEAAAQAPAAPVLREAPAARRAAPDRMVEERSAAAEPVGGARPRPFPGAPGDQTAAPAAAPTAPAPGGLRDEPAAREDSIKGVDAGRSKAESESGERRPLSRVEETAKPGDADSAAPSTPAPPKAAAMARAPARASGAASEGGQGRLAKETATDERIAALVKSLDREPPEKWLARIRELRRAGTTADADALLGEFRRRFPGHPLPSGLE